MVYGLQHNCDCSAILRAAGMQDELLDFGSIMWVHDSRHSDIVVQLLQAGADVQAVSAQVRPAATLCICALFHQVTSKHGLFAAHPTTACGCLTAET